MLESNKLGLVPVIFTVLHVSKNLVELFEELLTQARHALLVLIFLLSSLDLLLLVSLNLLCLHSFLICNLLSHIVECILDRLIAVVSAS